ncbi:hypothetical protein [Amycolatopsis albispora]|uniref:hypothetical protein n=1 Tax=Amycolatopsis albispora TaxID=1804986 RepID=UPI0013B37A12|nr:hypothetical protein [Amycolatopsis albispora]
MKYGRTVAALVTAGLAVSGLTAAHAAEAQPVYFVHGYNEEPGRAEDRRLLRG